MGERGRGGERGQSSGRARAGGVVEGGDEGAYSSARGLAVAGGGCSE